MLEHVQYVNLLLDFYAPLLTAKQKNVLEAYYGDNLSLGEISENNSVSRQAVHDLLQRSEATLLQYEEKLKLVDRFLQQQQTAKNVLHLLDAVQTEDNYDLLDNIRAQLKTLSQ